jgi:AhpD family alkylhydroperoxidase
MASEQTVQEIEETFGQVPGFMQIMADPVSDHSWGIFRDLILAETELSPREKALVGVSAAAAMQCPYCAYFHKEEARFADVSEAGIEEAVNLAGSTRYFSTLLHGNEYEHDDFVAETDDIFEHLRKQEEAAADD